MQQCVLAERAAPCGAAQLEAGAKRKKQGAARIRSLGLAAAASQMTLTLVCVGVDQQQHQMATDSHLMLKKDNLVLHKGNVGSSCSVCEKKKVIHNSKNHVILVF